MKRVQTDTHIEVNYENRYSLYDEVEQVQKPVIENRSIKTATAVP